MKKQFIALGVASLLTAPSSGFADEHGNAPNLYGSFRVNLSSQDGETSIVNNGSRWGVKGTPEVSEGLNAVYRYEQGLDFGSKKAKDVENRLSFVGISGGFGSLTAGTFTSATYAHTGSYTDLGFSESFAGHAKNKVGNAISYAASTGPVSFQFDVQMKDPSDENSYKGSTEDSFVKDSSVDEVQFGLSFDTGFAKVGLAARNKPLPKEADADNDGQPDEPDKKDGAIKTTGVAFSVPMNGYTFAAAWHNKKVRKQDADKQVVGAVGGPVADTGLNFVVSMSDRDDGTNPYYVELSQSIGGGASFAYQYQEPDAKDKMGEDVGSKSVLQLKVDF